MGDRTPERLPDKPPDVGSPVAVRAGCGALFGAVIPFGGAALVLGSSPLVTAVIVMVSAASCAFLAVRFGERFWEWITS